VLISDPSWENHRALFTNAGFEVGTYPYYDAATRGVRFDACWPLLNARRAGTIVVLHACCHNPTGCDLTPAQWAQVVEVVKARGLVAFLDMAYQGFGEGIAEDGAVIGQFLAAGRATSSCRPRSRRASRCTASASARSAWSAPARTRRRACCRS
jgi:aromatic-amino-acid transaminase